MAGTENFNGTPGQLLTARGWTRIVGTHDIGLDSGTGTGLSAGTGSSINSATICVTPSPETGDCFIEGLLLSNLSIPFIWVRTTSGVRTGYYVQRGSGNVVELLRHDGTSSPALLGSFPSTNAILSANKLRLEVSGSPGSQQLRVVLQGSTIIGPVTENTYTTGSTAVGARGSLSSSITGDDVAWGPLSSGAVTATFSDTIPIILSASATVGEPVTANLSHTIPIIVNASASTGGPVTATFSHTIPIIVNASASTGGPVTATFSHTITIAVNASASVGGPLTATFSHTIPITLSAFATVSNPITATFSFTVPISVVASGGPAFYLDVVPSAPPGPYYFDRDLV